MTDACGRHYWDIADYTTAICKGNVLKFGKMDIRAECPFCGYSVRLDGINDLSQECCPSCKKHLHFPRNVYQNAVTLCEHDAIETLPNLKRKLIKRRIKGQIIIFRITEITWTLLDGIRAILIKHSEKS